MKTFKFSLVLRTRENTDVFITLDDNIYGIYSKRVNILYVSAQQHNALFEDNSQQRNNFDSNMIHKGKSISVKCFQKKKKKKTFCSGRRQKMFTCDAIKRALLHALRRQRKLL